jgi:DNA-binding transcriptional ArsR family regulator
MTLTRMIRARAADRRRRRLDVQMVVMNALIDNGTATALQVTKLTGLPQRQTGRTLRLLTRFGLVTAKPRPGDRSGVRLYSPREGVITALLRAGHTTGDLLREINGPADPS